MSTDHQRYSTENQSAAIRKHADERGIEIVRTYADHGKSGLSLAGRSGLKNLIDDVRAGRADFDVILVYDVSRWGRFQDADGSAFYEYQCRKAGIPVEYCIDGFENDGSPVATIVKGVKRALTGEGSRLLSVRVFAGQGRLIELGFHQGGHAGFGLRRHLLDGAGNRKARLARGEHKSLQTDRVILVPGPPEEVVAVRWIYRSFVEEGRSENEIAALLNARRITTNLGRPWRRGTVHQILINEKYVGDNVWNRIWCKLQGARVRNRPDMWIRRDGAFEPLVDRMEAGVRLRAEDARGLCVFHRSLDRARKTQVWIVRRDGNRQLRLGWQFRQNLRRQWLEADGYGRWPRARDCVCPRPSDGREPVRHGGRWCGDDEPSAQKLSYHCPKAVGRSRRNIPWMSAKMWNMARYDCYAMFSSSNAHYLSDDGRAVKPYIAVQMAETARIVQDLYIDRLALETVGAGQSPDAHIVRAFNGDTNTGSYATGIMQFNTVTGGPWSDVSWCIDYMACGHVLMWGRDGEAWIKDLWESWFANYQIGCSLGPGACVAYSAEYKPVSMETTASVVQSFEDYWQRYRSSESSQTVLTRTECPSTSDASGGYRARHQHACRFLATAGWPGAHGHTYQDGVEPIGTVFAGSSSAVLVTEGGRWEI